jgi:hypothetical protein
LDIPGFNAEDLKNLLNAFYKYFGNGGELEDGLVEPKIYPGMLQFRENESSVLGSVGLVNFHGSCDQSFVCPNTTILKKWFQNEGKCIQRGLTSEERVAALRYLD